MKTLNETQPDTGVLNYGIIVIPPFVHLYKRQDNLLALVSGLSRVQADKLWYSYFIPPSSMYTLLSMKYFMLNLAISDERVMNTNSHYFAHFVIIHEAFD